MPVHTHQQDTRDKIDELNRTAWQIRISNSSEAAKLSNNAVELSRNISYKKGLADALRVNAFGFIRTAKAESAKDCLDEATSIYEAIGDVRGLAVVNEYKGIIERYKGNTGLSLEYIFTALEQSRQTNFIDNEVTNLYQIGVSYRSLANYEKALEYLYQSLSLARDSGFVIMEGYNLQVIGSIYFETDEYPQALNFYKQALQIRRQGGDKWGEAGSLDNIGFTYLKLKDYKQAADYCTESLKITQSTDDKKGQGNASLHLADICKETGAIKEAADYCNQSLEIRKLSGDKRGEAEIMLFMAELYQNDESPGHNTTYWLKEAQKLSEEVKAIDLESKTHFLFYQFYKENKSFEEAVAHLEKHVQLEKELHKNTISQKVLNIETSNKAEVAKKEVEQERLRNQELTNLNEAIEDQKKRLELALKDLKMAQAQLVHAEKMASLGELTAGIAHEIQNPLNFVNNFTDLNTELLDELTNEVEKENWQEVKSIAANLKDNEQKINHHGKRADAIVKGMLQHSRNSKGEKEPTDINALADEYLRLSYQGFRAKDPHFNAKVETNFDPLTGKINIVPQEIGRVLLNLYNNAFYAANLPASRVSQTLNDAHKPEVSVTTRKLLTPSGRDRILISVKDNGPGIPANIVDKIFQPFFTTKPTGQGTGLGLSLSYDIVKAHGGEIKVETTKGEETTFTFELPVDDSLTTGS